MTTNPIIPPPGIERRVGWHTPNDCFKVINVQTAMDGVNARLDEGHIRMCAIEAGLASANDCVSRGEHVHARLETKVDSVGADAAELLEIIKNAKGFFRVVGKISGWLRTFLLWTLPLATAVLSFWYVISNQPPHK